MKTKRGSLKKTLLTKIIIYSAIIIVVITQLSIKLAVDNIEPLTYNILARESLQVRYRAGGAAFRREFLRLHLLSKVAFYVS